jgi:limonene-1,2-epoxide hydrolase
VTAVALARPLALVIVLAAALSGCGGGSSGSASQPEDVIRAWSKALQTGDGVAAASYFTVPAVVENGTPPIKLSSRAEVIFFNMTLPCGGEVERTSQRGDYTDVIFKLTDRPGGDCGTGAGQEVATAFLVRNGKITEWRRLPDPDTQAPAKVGGPTV